MTPRPCNKQDCHLMVIILTSLSLILCQKKISNFVLFLFLFRDKKNWRKCQGHI
jgi:hypothetical protein